MRRLSTMRFTPPVFPGGTSYFHLPARSAVALAGVFLRFGGKGYTLRRVLNIRLVVDGRVLYEFLDARQVRDLNFMRGLPHRLLAKRRKAPRANVCIYTFGEGIMKRAPLPICDANVVTLEFALAPEFVAPVVDGLLVLEWK